MLGDWCCLSGRLSVSLRRLLLTWLSEPAKLLACSCGLTPVMETSQVVLRVRSQRTCVRIVAPVYIRGEGCYTWEIQVSEPYSKLTTSASLEMRPRNFTNSPDNFYGWWHLRHFFFLMILFIFFSLSCWQRRGWKCLNNIRNLALTFGS